jgi:lipopolysaccharide transport system ATP-binding protein
MHADKGITQNMSHSHFDSSETKILSLQHVGLYYSRRQRFLKRSRFWALRDVSFDLHAGETLGVIGRNGVGKSTLLRVLAGIIAPNTGKMVVHRPGLRISLISLGAGFVPFLSGRENAILSGMMLGATKKEILSRMDDIVAFAELNGFFEQPVNTYSTGMRARLGFSVSYHIDPDVILLDEVLGVGDEVFRIKSTAAMKERIKSEKTVVLVSHTMPLLREVCDRLVWIEDGKTQAQGKVSEVLEAYLKSIAPGTKQALGKDQDRR